MTRQETTNYYRRLCRVVRKSRICVKLADYGDEFGRMDWGEPDKLVINPRRRSPVMRTVIHELLHLLDDEMPECKVLALEKELFESMTDGQLNGLFKKVMAYDLDMAT